MNLTRGLVTAVQLILALRVLRRMAATVGGATVKRVQGDFGSHRRASILVPVLNEERRLAACLAGLSRQSPTVREILVIDGGSTDGTLAVIDTARAADPRIRAIPFATTDIGRRNAKALQLQAGLEAADPTCDVILTIDADVRAEDGLVDALVAHADANQLDALSVATLQRVSGIGEALIHPSMLTTLVYRFGIPGNVFTRVGDVQANGQCMLLRRGVLNDMGGFAAVADSICEDVTLARSLVAAGKRVGFYETDGLVATEMYAGFSDALGNWTRSLPMRDRHSGNTWMVGLAEVLFVQALPIWRVLTGVVGGRRGIGYTVNRVLLSMRLGVLAGTARAYPNRPWTWWLSPLMDLLVAHRLVVASLRSTHTWRGRTISTGRNA